MRTPTPAAAQQAIVLRRPALHWVRSEEAMSCIDPRTLAEHVETLIGPVLVRPSEAEHTVEGQVESVGQGTLRVRVRVLDGQGNKVGERQFEQTATECSVLTPAIVFVIGMTIDPEVAAHGLPPALVALLGQSGPLPEQALLEELEQTPVAPVREAEPSERTPQSKRAPVIARVQPRWQNAEFVRAAYGEAPRVLMSADSRMLYTLKGPFSIGGYLRGGVQVGPHKILEGARQIRAATFDGGLLSCAGESPARLVRLQGCLGVELATVVAWGTAFPNGDLHGAGFGVGLVAQLTARIRLHERWGLAVLATGRFATRRESFTIKNDSGPAVQVAQLPWLSAGLGLGPTYEF